MRIKKRLNRNPHLNISRHPKGLLVISASLCLAFTALAVYGLFFYHPSWATQQTVALTQQQDGSYNVSSQEDMLDYVTLKEPLALKVIQPETAGFIYSKIELTESLQTTAPYTYQAKVEDELPVSGNTPLHAQVYYRSRSELPLFYAILK